MAGLAEYINPSASTKQKRYERSKGWMDSVDDFIAPVTGAISGAVDDFEVAATPFIPPELRYLPLSVSDIGSGALTLAQMINPLTMIDQAMTDSGDAGDGTQTVVGADGKWYDRELTLEERGGLADASTVEAVAAVLPAAIYGRVMGSSAGSVMTEAFTGITTSASAANTVAGADISKIIANAEAGQPVIRLDDKYRGDGPMASTVVSKTADGRPINNPTFSVRVTQQSQIDDMIESGVIRSKEGGHKDGSSQLYFNTQDTPNPAVDGYRDGKKAFINYPNINNDQLMIVAPTHWIEDSMGPIPLDRLLHVWKYVDGKAVDILPDIIKKNRQYGDGEGLAAAKAKQTGKPKEGMTRRTFNKGAAATAVGGSVAVAGGDIIVDAVKATAKKAAKAASKRGGPFADVFTSAMKSVKEKEGELELSGISRTEIDVMRGRTIHDSDASIYATNADGEFLDPRLIDAHEAEQEALLAMDDANSMIVTILGIRGGLDVDDMAQLSDDQLEEMLDQITKYESNIYYPEYSMRGGDGGPRPDLDPYEYRMAREENEELISDAKELLRNEIETRKLPDDGTEGMTFEEIMARDPDAPVEGEFAKLRRERAERIALEKAEELAKQQADQVWFEKYLPVGWKTGGF
tara:strand:+ start:1817 stop:3721 length:1905 start_codon:yes stop_codon:yes gene_type:complete